MAERGFVTLAWDASFNGESGGQPRNIASPDIFTEDYSAAVDYIGTRPYVDRNRIGVIGICAGGGFTLNAASIDPRLKAIATINLYDTGRIRRQGLNDTQTTEAWRTYLENVANQRYTDFENGAPRIRYSTPEILPENAAQFVKEFYEYYRSPRGQHVRATTGTSFTSNASFMNYYPVALVDKISPRPILFVVGENAYSKYFSEDAYRLAAEPKELYVVTGATHVDLYDRMNLIPFNKLTDFFNKNLK